MAIVTVPQYSGVQQADTSATANTIAYRDSLGGLAGVQVLGSELKSSGTLTIAVAASQTATFTAGTSAIFYPCDATGGAITVNLPAAAGVTGRVYVVKKTDSSGNAVTIDPSGAETIDGASTKVLGTQNLWSMFVSTGTAWFIIG